MVQGYYLAEGKLSSGKNTMDLFLDITAEVVLDNITNVMKKCSDYSNIVDKTSDVNRIEQVAICLRFNTDGEIKGSFIGFYAMPANSFDSKMCSTSWS